MSLTRQSPKDLSRPFPSGRRKPQFGAMKLWRLGFVRLDDSGVEPNCRFQMTSKGVDVV
jgi:hypothetical protein